MTRGRADPGTGPASRRGFRALAESVASTETPAHNEHIRPALVETVRGLRTSYLHRGPARGERPILDAWF